MLHREPGGNEVGRAIRRALISSVNWSEVLQKSLQRGVGIAGTRGDVEALGLTVVPFSSAEAELAAELWESTRRLGLSLGDRACIATGILAKAKVLTAERSWAKLDVGARIEVIRGRR